MSVLSLLSYRAYRLISWLRHTGRRRFTTPGQALCLALVFVIFLSLDTDNHVTYQALIFLLCLFVFASLGSWLFRARFSATRLLPRFGTVGVPLHYRLVLRNLTPTPQHDLALLEALSDPRPTSAQWKAARTTRRSRRLARTAGLGRYQAAISKEVRVPGLLPNRDTEVRLELTPLRRGVLRFQGITLARPDPLGLLRALIDLPLPQSVLILPKRYPLPPIALPGALKYQEGGVALASHVGQSDEFVSLRDYRHGDPLRHIHWRSWAKTGKPIVREFEDEFFVRHALVLDTFSDDPQDPVFEEAVSVAASFACTILTQESLLDLLFVGTEAYCLTAGRGLSHADQMLEILASVQPCRTQGFAALDHLVLRHAGVVSGCICVLLRWDRQRQELVRKLRTLDVPVLVLVVAGAGDATELDPGPMRDDPERLHVLEAGRIAAQLASIFHAPSACSLPGPAR